MTAVRTRRLQTVHAGAYAAILVILAGCAYYLVNAWASDSLPKQISTRELGLGMACLLILMSTQVFGILRSQRAADRRLLPVAGVLAVFAATTFGYLLSSSVHLVYVVVASVLVSNALSFPLAVCVGINGALVLAYAITPLLLQAESLLLAMAATFAATCPLRLMYDAALDANETLSQSARQSSIAAAEFADANVKVQRSLYFTEASIEVRERNRIAQEIHDVVGHTLTAALMHTRNQRLASEKDPDRMRQLIAETESLLQDAIAQVRKAVYAMREQAEINLSWQLRWRKICMIFAECTGVRIRASIADDLGFVDDRVGDSIARILQEALNNAIRHGNASYVHVTVVNQAEERTLLVKISDNGKGADVVKPSLGLDGIRERVAGLGGSAAWRTRPGRGFDIGVELPFIATDSRTREERADG